MYGNGRPGSRGHFKEASLITMGVLRQHKETLLAMLEAFAYDPLLAWSAKEIDPERGGQSQSSTSSFVRRWQQQS